MEYKDKTNAKIVSTIDELVINAKKRDEVIILSEDLWQDIQTISKDIDE